MGGIDANQLQELRMENANFHENLLDQAQHLKDERKFVEQKKWLLKKRNKKIDHGKKNWKIANENTPSKF